jgi:hypothetical protein
VEKLNFDINQLLRFLLAGGWTVICYFFTNPIAYKNLQNDKTLDLILISLVLGSIVFIIHRAIVYPFLFRLICIGLIPFKKMKWKLSLLIPFFPTKDEIKVDFHRWALRRDTKKSLSKNITDWGSQIHFLYCCAIGSLLTIIFSKLVGGYEQQKLRYMWWAFGLLLFCGFINHIRALLYDIELRKREKEPQGSKDFY